MTVAKAGRGGQFSTASKAFGAYEKNQCDVARYETYFASFTDCEYHHVISMFSSLDYEYPKYTPLNLYI